MNKSESVVQRHTNEADRLEKEAAERLAKWPGDALADRQQSQAAAHRRLAAKKLHTVERTY